MNNQRSTNESSWENPLYQLLHQVRRRLNNRFPLIILAIVVAVWLLSGIYTVGPGEMGVIRQFGREYTITEPGLRYHLPWPVQHVTIVDIDTVRSATVGYRIIREDYVTMVPREALMLTGDENIIKIHLFIQYTIKDPSDFVFRVHNPEDVLHSAAEVALRGMVGIFTVDYTMTEGRAEVQELTRLRLQELLDDYQSGLLIREARILTADPPEQVEDAFHEVVRALEDRERLVEEAEGYREDVIPRARGEAARILAGAEAYREKRILEAQGDVARFLEVHREYTLAPAVTRERMYLEVIETALGDGNVNLVIIDPDIGRNILPLLDLGRLSGEVGGGN